MILAANQMLSELWLIFKGHLCMKILLFLLVLFRECRIETEHCPFFSQNETSSAKIAILKDSECLDGFPRHFRTLAPIGLPIFASAQFSKSELVFMMNSKPSNKPLVILDLRKEFHGFLNGIPISWFCPRNWHNAMSTGKEIEFFENQRLQFIQEQKQVEIFYKQKEFLYNSTIIAVKDVCSERHLAESLDSLYVRIPISDHRHPSENAVRKLLNTFKRYPLQYFHYLVHGRGGAGRTTLVLVMIDIIQNEGRLSFHQIIKRQFSMGRSDLSDVLRHKDSYKFTHAVNRLKFLVKFYLKYGS